MDKDLENEIDLKLERAFRSFLKGALKGNGGHCDVMHKLSANEVKKCVQKEQNEFYKKMLWTGVGGIIILLVGQIIMKTFLG